MAYVSAGNDEKSFPESPLELSGYKKISFLSLLADKSVNGADGRKVSFFIKIKLRSKKSTFRSFTAASEKKHNCFLSLFRFRNARNVLLFFQGKQQTKAKMYRDHRINRLIVHSFKRGPLYVYSSCTVHNDKLHGNISQTNVKCTPYILCLQ